MQMDCARKSLDKNQMIDGRGEPLIEMTVEIQQGLGGHSYAERNTVVPESHCKHPAYQGSVGDAGYRFGYAGYGSTNRIPF
jgi:hypothetical protein